MWKSYSCVIFIAFSLVCINAENAKLTVDLLNTGFHRDLNYIIVFPEYQGKPHTFLIRQLLPASVYVSTDQLDDLKRFEKINYFIESGHVDIEKPTEKSEPFHIHVFGNAAFLQTIFLPIHFRYHGPSNKSFVAVNITLPQVFLEWDDNEEDTNGTIPVSYTCKDLRHKCKWIQVEYDNYSRKPISVNIPIGNADLRKTIAYSTIAISWAAALYIIVVIRSKCKMLKTKFK